MHQGIPSVDEVEFMDLALKELSCKKSGLECLTCPDVHKTCQKHPKHEVPTIKEEELWQH